MGYRRDQKKQAVQGQVVSGKPTAVSAVQVQRHSEQMRHPEPAPGNVAVPQQAAALPASSSAPEDRQAPTSLLADMRQLVTKVKLSGRTAPEVRHLAEEYAQLLEAKAVPSIAAGYKEHQRLLQEHADSFLHCDADLAARLDTGQRLQLAYDGWSVMHKDCRHHEARLHDELENCNHRLGAASARRQAACEMLNTSDAQASAQKHSNNVSLMALKRSCQDASRNYMDQWSICAEGERFYDTKRAECDSVQQSMRMAGCARASQVSGICDMYDLCRSGMALAYTSAKEAARAWERYHKAEWLAVVTIRCFADNLSKQDNSAALLAELERCEQVVGNTKLFDLEYKDVPPAMSCTPVSDSLCAEQGKLLQGPASPLAHDAPAADVAHAVAVDASQALPAAAVSFVQKGIQRASRALPTEMHQALFGALAMPMALTLASLSVIALLARCMLQLGQKWTHKDQKNEPQSPLAVDAWCISSAELASAVVMGGGASSPARLVGAASAESADAAAHGADVADQSRWLCPELIVPKGTCCVIMLPFLNADCLESGPASFLVTDKLGQPLFRASLARFTSSMSTQVEEQPTGTVTTELLTLMRQDGTPLATGELSMVQAASSSDCAILDCKVLQRDGQHFAVLRQHVGQVSWLPRIFQSRADRLKAADKAGFIFESARDGAWQLQIQRSPTGGLAILDGLARPVAAAERTMSFGINKQSEFYKVEVSGECESDLGLVTAILLLGDRMLVSRVSKA